MSHLHRECFHAQWTIILDEELLKAIVEGLVIVCPDGVTRRFFIRIFTYAADYPERWAFSLVPPFPRLTFLLEFLLRRYGALEIVPACGASFRRATSTRPARVRTLLLGKPTLESTTLHDAKVWKMRRPRFKRALQSREPES